MKKLTILSGPMASGKTHICKAIEMQHKKESICHIYYGESLLKINKVFSLIIVDTIPSDKILETYIKIEEKAPDAKLVFTTQDLHVSMKQFGSFAHVINCRNAYV